MQVVPMNRIPKTWEQLPDGHIYYEYANNMYLFKDGSAGIPVQFDEDEDDPAQSFRSEPPSGNAYLKITKRGEGVDVVAYKMPKDYIFRSHSQGVSYGDLLVSDKLADVLSYKEVKERKPVKKKKGRG